MRLSVLTKRAQAVKDSEPAEIILGFAIRNYIGART